MLDTIKRYLSGDLYVIIREVNNKIEYVSGIN